ncbi:GTPase CgtA [Erysipelothrix larvae]|uniref:GTPase Obg n=1 Tax=Erysipelothrix larvae TaxID=1514105 RepID=A0A0X8GZJ5_9FIRM|nr:GTPase ObgE [Erysipelothrix larvae]AMC93311.1 GTPase CgtA [Erysipelothrix larvae]
MFVDRVKIKVIAGNGGNGMSSFRREPFVPLGGPYGGDGGKGGDIVLVGDSNKTTLLDFRYHRIVKADRGQNGKNKRMHGRGADDIVIPVPLGTIVKDIEKDIVVADIVRQGQRVVVANGGRGGRGNARFKTHKDPAPTYAEKGLIGETKELVLELKLLADVGLVGFPSVGKSTLLSVVTRAKPEIADYHFTTLSPNLGIASSNDGRSFVIADLPGLIEDAHQGKGLGHVFLRHIERCRVLCHVVDMGAEDGRDPVEDFKVINNELLQYSEDILERPMVVVANKMDLDPAKANLKRFKEAYPEVEVFEMITVVGEGKDALLYRLADLLDENRQEKEIEQAETVVFKYEAPKPKFEVVPLNPGLWEVTGEKIDKLFDQFDVQEEDEAIQFGMAMKRLGVDQALRDAGCKHGDTVILGDIQFEFDEGVIE